jgi:hypothetical protein
LKRSLAFVNSKYRELKQSKGEKMFNKNELISIIVLVTAITPANPNQNTISTDFSLKIHAVATVDLTIENVNKPAPKLKSTPKNQLTKRCKNKSFRHT